MPNNPALTPRHIVSRIAAGLFGSYVFVWGSVALGMVLLANAGMPYNDAQTLAYLLAFLVFLIAFCWGFVAANLTRVWVVLVGGGLGMTGLAWLLARSLA